MINDLRSIVQNILMSLNNLYELNEHGDDEEFEHCQQDNTDRATLTSITATYKECKETLIDVIDDLTRHSHIAKLKITSS